MPGLLVKLANELEDKVELAAMLPGRILLCARALWSVLSSFAGWSPKSAHLSTSSAQGIWNIKVRSKRSTKRVNQLDALLDEWYEMLMNAEQAAGL